MKNLSYLLLTISLTLITGTTHAIDSAVSSSPEDASVYIISPTNGEVVTGPVSVMFGLRGMGVAPAGTVKENTGHHHLLIDGKELPTAGQPMGKNVKHFGGGQTETTVELDKGEHTLQLIMGNHMHIPHNPPVVSEIITITVE